MNKKDFFSRSITVIFAIALLFFLFTEVFIVVKNTIYADADNKIEKLNKEKKRLQKVEMKLKEFKNFGSDYSKFKANKFIKYKDFSTFRNNLDKLLSQYNFLSKSFNFSGKIILKEFIKVPLSIRLKGQYVDLKRFIYDINRMDNFVYFLNSINLKKTKSIISGDFSMEVYFVK